MSQSKVPVVETANGKLAGYQHYRESVDVPVHVFKGVPYAGSVAGAGRFQPAPPAPSWTGVREAIAYGPQCPQFAINEGLKTDRGMYGQLLSGAHELPSNEDCLFLNIWTPALNDGGKRPVMVWLHTGGYHLLSGSNDMADGTRLCRRSDVVVVTLNHRLGVLGFLYLDDLGDERFVGSGNIGMLDIASALQWIRDNIEAFGGDPDRVTIFGPSGGGAKTTTALAMPPMRGLFHRAIAQSGVDAVGLLPEAAAATRDRVLTALDIQPDRLDKLLEVPAEDLLSATERAGNSTYPGAGFFPVVDGTNLPAHPVEAIAAGSARDVPLIIGTMREETAINTFYDPATGRTDHRGEWEAVPPMLGDRADEVIEIYRRGRPSADETELYIAITSDRLRVPAIRIAEAKLAGGGAPVYMYLGAYRHPYMGGAFGAVHGTDQPLVFENLHLVPSLAQEPQAWELAAKVAGAWSAFAASGDPSTPDMPAWPSYSLERRSTMVLDVESHIEDDPNADERRAWDGMDLRGTGLVSRTPSRR